MTCPYLPSWLQKKPVGTVVGLGEEGREMRATRKWCVHVLL